MDTVDKVMLLWTVEGTPGINTCMNYNEGECTYLPFHIEDLQLSPICFLRSGPLKILYVIPSSNQTLFEDFVASHIFDHEYVNGHHGRAIKIIALKNLWSNQRHLEQPGAI